MNKFDIITANDIPKTGRRIDRIFIHCSASSNPKVTVRDIEAWHKARGWSGIGYHFFVNRAGTIFVGRDINKTPAAQGGKSNMVKAYKGGNAGTIAICFHGGGGDPPKDDFTGPQMKTLEDMAKVLHEQYGNATFHGHCEVAFKACPVFDYQKVLNLDKNGHIGLGGRRPMIVVKHNNIAPPKPIGGASVVSPKPQATPKPAPVKPPVENTLLGWLKRTFWS